MVCGSNNPLDRKRSEKTFNRGKGLIERGNNPLLCVEMCVLILLSAMGKLMKRFSIF